MNSIRRLLYIALLFFAARAYAQFPPACPGGMPPAIACAEACIFCNFDGYTGSTAGYPSGIVPNFCGTVENAQWMGFIAGATSATFTVSAFNCSDGNGVQVALYEDCMGQPLACDKGEENGDGIPVSITVPMTIGANYFLMIDGYAGDQCEFTVDVSPVEAVYQPPLGVVQEVSGPTSGCAGATFTYTVQPVSGAGGYIWDGPPGTLVDSMPVPVTTGRTVQLTLGTQSGNICVQAANACAVNPPCSASMFVEVLPDSERPQIAGDSTATLNCLGTPLTLRAEVTPAAAYTYSWSVDSLGSIVGGQHSLQVRVDSVGVYRLLVLNPLNGCTASADYLVGPPEMPVGSSLSLRHIRCYGSADGSVQLGGVEMGTPPYLYSLDDGPLHTEPVFQFLEPGTHQLTVEDAAGCTWDTVFTLEQPDQLLLALGADTTVHLGQTLELWRAQMVNFPDRVAKVAVSPDWLTPFICPGCVFCPQNSMRYTIMVSDSNGCTARSSRQITVDKTRYVYIPNVFKPGGQQGDAGNAVFRVFCGEDVSRINRFQVFSRWGQLVHERLDFDPADLSGGWDGTWNGRLLDPGVMIYFVELTYKDGQTELFRGDVTLLR